VLQLRQGSIWIGGIPIVPRSDVREGVVIPASTQGTIVRLVTRTGLVALRAKNVDEAKAVLEQLGLDVAHHAATFTIRSRNRSAFMRRLWLMLGAFVGFVFATSLLGGLMRTPAFVALMVEHRPKALRGRSIREIFETTERQPARLEALHHEWLCDPSLMYRAQPMLVFAVIGQARSNGWLTPEDESTLVAKLLTYWALRATINTSELCAGIPKLYQAAA
jgi:hypothetical protein